MPKCNPSWPAPETFNRILLAYDGSQGARQALEVAIQLAQQYKAELHQMTVQECLPLHVEEMNRPVGFGRILSTEQEAADYFHGVSQEARTAATRRASS